MLFQWYFRAHIPQCSPPPVRLLVFRRTIIIGLQLSSFQETGVLGQKGIKAPHIYLKVLFLLKKNTIQNIETPLLISKVVLKLILPGLEVLSELLKVWKALFTNLPTSLHWSILASENHWYMHNMMCGFTITNIKIYFLVHFKMLDNKIWVILKFYKATFRN